MERRDFLHLLAGGFGAALMPYPLAVKAAGQGNKPMSFSAAEWRTLEAICEQIIPPVNGIGTRQAQCVNFIDKLLAHEEKSKLPFYRQGLAALNVFSVKRWRVVFEDLPESDRVLALEHLEDGEVEPWRSTVVTPTAFFRTLYFHTILGFLAAPSFGGNSKQLGWQAIGFPGHLHEQGGISDEQVEGLNFTGSDRSNNANE